MKWAKTVMAGQMQVVLATCCYCFSSVGMLLFNKLAAQHFPLECCLVWAQLCFTAFCLLIFGFPYIHIGSMRDLVRWCMVVPFYCGMLLTSILALKTAPMTLVIVLRNTSPLMTLVFERFYPEPLRINFGMLVSMFVMILGALMYVRELPITNWQGVGWVMLNSSLAVVDRLLQRLLLSKEQCPVDISPAGITLMNNFCGMLPVGSQSAESTKAWHWSAHFNSMPSSTLRFASAAVCRLPRVMNFHFGSSGLRCLTRSRHVSLLVSAFVASLLDWQAWQVIVPRCRKSPAWQSAELDGKKDIQDIIFCTSDYRSWLIPVLVVVYTRFHGTFVQRPLAVESIGGIDLNATPPHTFQWISNHAWWLSKWHPKRYGKFLGSLAQAFEYSCSLYISD